MSKYHAGKHGSPLCGSRGTANRFNMICLGPKDWNATPSDQRCAKCEAKIQTNKAAAAK